MKASVIHFSGVEELSRHLAQGLNAQTCAIELHQFPDGECCVQIDPEYLEKTAIVVASMNQPDELCLPLLFLAETLRDYNVEKIYLIAPYLAYMRQDERFKVGQGISALYFGRLISSYFDGLLTVDPHLHRIHSLDEIYSIPSTVVRAAPQIANWVQENIEKPVLIGPDSESEQWVCEVAELANAESVILEKTRHGDHDVEISVPDIQHWQGYTPVLIDDIISTGNTMIETAVHLQNDGLLAPVCIGVHGIFAGNAEQDLLNAGVKQIITSNTIQHPTNQIDLSEDIKVAVSEMIANNN